MFMLPVVLASVAAWQAPMPRHKHWLSRPLIAYLHWRQPIARGWARYSVRLKAKVLQTQAKRRRPPRELPVDPMDKRTLRYWSKVYDRLTLLEHIKRDVQAAGWRMRLDSGWAVWDMEIYGSRYVKVRLTSATEKHADGMLTRVRVELLMSTFCKVLMAGSLILMALLFVYVWPFSRPALLIPMVWWTMYLVNNRLVAPPVLSLIDEAAEEAGFYPVHPPKPVKRAKPVPLEDDIDLDEHSPSVA